MTAVTRNTLAAAFAVLILAACPPATKPDGGTPQDAGNTCADAIDCPDPQLFACNQTTLTCEPSCRVKTDCLAAARGQYALDYCDSSARGCECDEGKCVASLCSSDTDCGSQVCRNGQCVAPPAASTVASCRITPDYVILKPGATAKFWVSAWDANKNPVVVKEGATWTALGSNLTVPSSTTGISAVYTAGPAGAAADSVQASFGTANCKAKALILAAPAQGTVGVLVYDELSNRPIEGARVMVSDTATGAVVQQTGAVDALPTGANGYVAVAPGASATISVSVFHNDYSYLTIAGYANPAGGPDGNFLAFAVRRNQSDKYGGYKGTFTNVPASSNIHGGIAGMSLAGSITNLSLGQLLGPSQPTDIVIGSAINQKGVMIPAGAYLGFGDSQIKPNIAGQGLAGSCVDGTGAADETKIKAGTCGTRTAWALAGDVAIVDLPIDQLAGGLNNIDVGKLLARIVPIFKKFNSSIVRDVQFDLRATPLTGGKYDFSNQDQFVTTNHNFTQMPLAFGFAAKLPDLPKFKGNYADAVALIGGANVPGRGVVPLGIGVGANGNGDAKVDKPDDLPAAGMVKMRMAPTHDGIEGNEYGIVMAALSTKGLTDASAGLALSAIFPRIKDNKLIFDPTGATYADFSASTFPPFPEGAKYNYSDNPQGALTKRLFQFKAAVTGVSVVRVSFGDDMDHHWDVLMDAAQATTGFTLPKPPTAGGPFIDRTFADGMGGGGRSSMLVQAFSLNSNPAGAGTALTFANLVELNSTNLDRTTDFLSAFSLEDYAPPSISFKTPNADGAMVAKGSNIVVNVKSFKVGPTDDGVVKFTFSSGGNPVAGCTEMNVSAEATAGTGDVQYTIPATCTGVDVIAKAQLYLPDGTTALDPIVATTRTMTIPP